MAVALTTARLKLTAVLSVAPQLALFVRLSKAVAPLIGPVLRSRAGAIGSDVLAHALLVVLLLAAWAALLNRRVGVGAGGLGADAAAGGARLRGRGRGSARGRPPDWWLA